MTNDPTQRAGDALDGVHRLFDEVLEELISERADLRRQLEELERVDLRRQLEELERVVTTH